MSLWAGILGDGDRAVQLTLQANALLPRDTGPALQAWFAAREASAYSRAGIRSAALHALDRAEALAGQADDGSVWPWTQPFGRGGLAGYRGAIAATLKLPDMAVPALQEAFSGPLRPVSKYHALVLGDLAASYLPAGEVEESARLTAVAFDIGVQRQRSSCGDERPDRSRLSRKGTSMSRVVVTNHVTLDGVMQAPAHPDEDASVARSIAGLGASLQRSGHEPRDG